MEVLKMVKEINHEPRNIYAAKFLTIQEEGENIFSNKQRFYSKKKI